MNDQNEPKTEHAFTPAQQARVNMLDAQRRKIDETLRFFLAYVIDEAGLPPTPAGYRISPDLTRLEPVPPVAEVPHRAA